jgi:copper chaperone
METIQMGVQGMTCMGCVTSVTKVLRNLSGVTDVRVSLEQASAEITFDPASTNLAAFRAAVEGAGFEAA